MLCGKRCVVNFIATCYNKSYRQHQFERSASMENLSIPVGISDFEEIRRKGYYYVDKSMLISKLLIAHLHLKYFVRSHLYNL